MALLIGVDPGGTTGLCQWYTGTQRPDLLQLDPGRTMDYLESVARWHATVFVVETYTITAATAKMSQQHDALELIGVVKYLARGADLPVHFQSPSEAKKFSTDAKLKKAGWYQPGLPHARDASRHVLLYAAKNGLIDLATLIGG